MLQNLLGTPDLELPDQAEVLPSPSASIVHLTLKIAQLGLLCFAHHLNQSTDGRKPNVSKQQTFCLYGFVYTVSAMVFRSVILGIQQGGALLFFLPSDTRKSRVQPSALLAIWVVGSMYAD